MNYSFSHSLIDIVTPLPCPQQTKISVVSVNITPNTRKQHYFARQSQTEKYTVGGAYRKIIHTKIS